MENKADPLSGLIPLSNGDMVMCNQNAFIGVKPNGYEYKFIDVDIEEPHNQSVHHQPWVRDYDAEYALILFNKYGDGVKCDLKTPTDHMLGDVIAIVDKNGTPTWTWSVFDHKDAIPPEAMNQSVCRSCHFGLDTFDWTHGNSVVPFPGENALLASFRNVLRVVKIDIDTGDVLWQMGPGLDFQWIGDEPELDKWFRLQHDAHWLEGDHLLLFDNGACRYQENCFEGEWSRGLELEVDQDAKTVRLVWEYRVPFTHAHGNVERNANGNTLVSNGWACGVYEISADRQLLWHMQFDSVDKLSMGRYVPAWWSYDATPPTGDNAENR